MLTTYRTDTFGLGATENIAYAMQLNDGDVGISEDGNTFLHTVDARAGSISKSTLNVGFEPVDAAGIIAVEMDFMIPDGYPTDQIFLADFESGNANIGTNPGVRIYLRDGMIRVDRAKIGLDETWVADHAPITTGEWFSLRAIVTAGDDDVGKMQIYLNGQLVLEENGSTVLTQSVMDQFNLTLEGGELDRVQLGLTANNGPNEASVATRDMSIQTFAPDMRSMLNVELDPRSVIENASHPIEVIAENFQPDTGDAPQDPVVVEEPVTEEPVVEEPVVEDPEIEEPDVVEAHVVDKEVEDTDDVEEPVVEDPGVVEDPVLEDPVVEDPVVEDPVVEDPVEIVTDEEITEEEITGQEITGQEITGGRRGDFLTGAGGNDSMFGYSGVEGI